MLADAGFLSSLSIHTMYVSWDFWGEAKPIIHAKLKGYRGRSSLHNPIIWICLQQSSPKYAIADVIIKSLHEFNEHTLNKALS
jgi:hypothetical protein